MRSRRRSLRRNCQLPCRRQYLRRCTIVACVTCLRVWHGIYSTMTRVEVYLPVSLIQIQCPKPSSSEPSDVTHVLIHSLVMRQVSPCSCVLNYSWTVWLVYTLQPSLKLNCLSRRWLIGIILWYCIVLAPSKISTFKRENSWFRYYCLLSVQRFQNRSV